MAACRSCDVGYLSRFADYAVSLESESKKAVENQFGKFGRLIQRSLDLSWFRIGRGSFMRDAYEAGLRLIPQYPVEKYIVDFLMADGDRKLAIEIDGERYHRNWTGELCRRDQIRNQRLFELGYDVMRFWVYEVRDDLEGCLRRLKEWAG